MRKKIINVATLLTTISNMALAQALPPGIGGCTNCPPVTNYIAASPYIPGLKVAAQSFNGSNLPISLLEADPAGKYDIYYASNLSSAWVDVAQGTNSQTNFALMLSQSDMGYFKATRTDKPVTNAANMTVSFPDNLVSSSLVSASILNGPAAAMAVLVGSTNFSSATWIPFSASPYALIGTNDGTYTVWFGFRGSNGSNYWTKATITLDTVRPTIVITNPVATISTKPMIQMQGYSSKPIESLTFTITNSQGTDSGAGYVTSQYYDTNLFKLTTNWFEYVDIPLAKGTNFFSLQATDIAGNVTTTNLVYVFDTNGDTNAPIIALTWPQDTTQISATNFTLRGTLDDETASIAVQIVSTNGTTNSISGLVERDGKFWAQNLPLGRGTNLITITATDAAGNISTTNISVIQSAVTLTITPIPANQLWKKAVNMTGTISDTTYAVWVNGIKGHNNGNGTWSATNAPINSGGTVSSTATAYAPNEQQPDGSFGN